MTPEETIRQAQVRQARILEVTTTAVSRAWLSLGSYDAADVPRFIAKVQPIVERAATQMAAVVDSTSAALSNARPIGVASRIPETIVNPRSTPLEDVWRRPFFDHWERLSKGQDWQASVRASASRAETIAHTNTQMVMREAQAEIVRVHIEEPELVKPAARADGAALRVIADEQARLADLKRSNPGIDVAAEKARLAELKRQIAETPTEPQVIVGYRRTLTGKSCHLCAAAATKIYSIGDLAPRHTNCDCGVAPVMLGADPGLDANATILSNLKAQGKGYWKKRGFVDNDGNPLDPEELPESLGRSVTNAELGPVFAATA